MDSKSTTLPLGDSLITYDWREKLKLPLAPVESGAMWHAQQKVSLSCWGGAVFRHSETSSPAEPQLSTTYIFYVTDVVEQTAEASNLMLGEALKEVNVPTSGSLHLWSDTGPHYRSAENLYYYARTLPEQRKQKVFIRWLAEQHGKGVLDQQFGLSGTHNNGWIGMYARKHPIFTIGDMVEALKQGAEHQMKKDPTGPRYIVRQIEYPKHKSAVRQFLYADSLKITRTYMLWMQNLATAAATFRLFCTMLFLPTPAQEAAFRTGELTRCKENSRRSGDAISSRESRSGCLHRQTLMQTAISSEYGRRKRIAGPPGPCFPKETWKRKSQHSRPAKRGLSKNWLVVWNTCEICEMGQKVLSFPAQDHQVILRIPAAPAAAQAAENISELPREHRGVCLNYSYREILV